LLEELSREFQTNGGGAEDRPHGFKEKFKEFFDLKE
jgi:hypothetical protein